MLKMATEGQKVIEYSREYWGYQPDKEEGPTTLVLDTIVIPVDEEDE